MADASFETAAWRRGYEAALQDVERHAGELQERGGLNSLEGLLAGLRAALGDEPGQVDTAAPEAAGVPPEGLDREWTAG